MDLLSDLPLEIIHNILSFVPIREAIATSLLSSQWRYTWTSLPNLIFDFEHVNLEYDRDINRLLFRFITQVLLRHEGPIRKFEVHLPNIAMFNVQFQCFDQRLLFSYSNDIRILVLKFNSYKSLIAMHSSLYSCQNLNSLELQVSFIPPLPPSFKGFLFLRSLSIWARNVDSSTIERIVALSPLLEELLLFGRRQSEMTIRAPNLKIIFLVYQFTHLSLCTPLLEELIVYSQYIKHLSFHESAVFNHLRIIKLNDVRFRRTEETTAFNHLIKCSPNLQKLEISIYPFDLPDTESAPDFNSLKEIKLSFYDCRINEMKLAKFLLARSPALKKMICKPCSPLSEQVLLNLEAELLSCHRSNTRTGRLAFQLRYCSCLILVLFCLFFLIVSCDVLR